MKAERLHLILASGSPRRQELIALLGLPFTIVPSRYEEPLPPVTPIHLPDFVIQLAANKALEVAGRMPGKLVLGADTLVAPDDSDVGVPLGKPTDDEDACRMLRLLSGRAHRVYTGVALVKMGEDVRYSVFGVGNPLPNTEHLNTEHPLLITSYACTRVFFRELSERMIVDYVATGEPRDKAGAYGAQGYAAPFIERFEGDFFNVVGLPLCEAGRLIEKIDPLWWHERKFLPEISVK